MPPPTSAEFLPSAEATAEYVIWIKPRRIKAVEPGLDVVRGPIGGKVFDSFRQFSTGF